MSVIPLASRVIISYLTLTHFRENCIYHEYWALAPAFGTIKCRCCNLRFQVYMSVFIQVIEGLLLVQESYESQLYFSCLQSGVMQLYIYIFYCKKITHTSLCHSSNVSLRLTRRYHSRPGRDVDNILYYSINVRVDNIRNEFIIQQFKMFNFNIQGLKMKFKIPHKLFLLNFI